MSHDINDDKDTTDASLSGVENLTAKTKLEDTPPDFILRQRVERKKSFME
tara:strand:- start:93332 stop:93481 length:150 start_codon:yes stop_codon:yes gene_type:complete